MSTATLTAPLAGVGTSQVDDRSLSVEVGLPADDDSAALLAFAGGAGAVDSIVLWQRYRALHTLRVARLTEIGDVPAEFGRVCDPDAQIAASYSVAANVGDFAAHSFLDRAIACFERIPVTGRLLRDGAISPAAFGAAVLETALIEDEDVLAFVDAELAHRLSTLGGLSVSRVKKSARAIVLEADPDAARRIREETKAAKGVRLAPLTFELSELNVTLAAEDAQLSLAVLDAVIAGACKLDPRTKNEKRADAFVARMQGVPFTCMCGSEQCGAELSDEQVATRCANVVLHVIVREETLDGSSDAPAYLDGFGPISAEHVRDLAARDDAVARDLDVTELATATAQPADPYRPTATCDAAVRGLFGACTTPGCDRPAWNCDLDHVVEFNHVAPAAGGATCPCNLNPKCRLHHLIKTHVEGWVDAQFVDANGIVWTEVTTPEGFTARQQALNTWLLPEIGFIACSHNAPVEPGTADPDSEPRRGETRTEAKHRYRRQVRAANRRAREAEAAALDAAFGEPPF